MDFIRKLETKNMVNKATFAIIVPFCFMAGVIRFYMTIFLF